MLFLGLHNFKGSEGWLDSFKRRHNIDLKTMTGQPVIYEAEADLNSFCIGDNPTSTTGELVTSSLCDPHVEVCLMCTD